MATVAPTIYHSQPTNINIIPDPSDKPYILHETQTSNVHKSDITVAVKNYNLPSVENPFTYQVRDG